MCDFPHPQRSAVWFRKIGRKLSDVESRTLLIELPNVIDKVVVMYLNHSVTFYFSSLFCSNVNLPNERPFNLINIHYFAIRVD